jgi:hypothetical protein
MVQRAMVQRAMAQRPMARLTAHMMRATCQKPLHSQALNLLQGRMAQAQRKIHTIKAMLQVRTLDWTKSGKHADDELSAEQEQVQGGQ